MQTIPLQATQSQTVSCLLGGQYCQINVYQKAFGLFLDVYVGNTLVVAGIQCQDRNLLILGAYLGFVGNLMFVDTLGNSDPFWTGLGNRFALVYLTPADVAELVP